MRIAIGMTVLLLALLFGTLVSQGQTSAHEVDDKRPVGSLLQMLDRIIAQPGDDGSDEVLGAFGVLYDAAGDRKTAAMLFKRAEVAIPRRYKDNERVAQGYAQLVECLARSKRLADAL